MSENNPEKKNITWVVQNGLCAQCGFCHTVCPVHAIEIQRDLTAGENLPLVNKDRCIFCLSCIQVCPGLGVDFDRYYRTYLSRASYSKYRGYIKNAYIGYSSNRTHRSNSASGGLLSELAAFALESGILDYIVYAEQKKENPFQVQTQITGNPEQIRKNTGSIYFPVPLGRGLTELLETHISKNDRLGLIGLPCHIQGVHKLSDINRFKKYNWYLLFGIFCGGTWTYRATEAILRELGENKKSLVRFSFRGKGWPGKISWTRKDGSECEISRHHRKGIKNMVLSSIFLANSMYTPHRCFTCSDGLAELSDLAFGDPWLQSLKEETLGKTMVVVRTSKARDLLEQAQSAGVIRFKEVSDWEVMVAQKGMLMYKQNFQAFFPPVKLLGRKLTPQFNYIWQGKEKIPTSIRVYAYVSYTNYLIGKKFPWPWLRFFLTSLQSLVGRIIKKRFFYLTDRDQDNYFS